MLRAVLGLALAAAVGAQGNAVRPAITASAAISLGDALDEIVKAYAAAGGGPVRLNLAGSNVLARQIVNGAPADVFISADEAQMDVVQAANRVAPGTRVDLVRNQLAVVAVPQRAAYVRDRFEAAPADIRRLAIGDPAAVPAGVYARQYLESVGLWKAYESRIVPTANVRAALTAVENGSADAAIVYLTDTAMTTRAAVAFVVPAARGPRIVYPAAVLASSQDPDAARRFVAFLKGPEASAIFERYKFLPAAAR